MLVGQPIGLKKSQETGTRARARMRKREKRKILVCQIWNTYDNGLVHLKRVALYNTTDDCPRSASRFLQSEKRNHNKTRVRNKINSTEIRIIHGCYIDRSRTVELFMLRAYFKIFLFKNTGSWGLYLTFTFPALNMLKMPALFLSFMAVKVPPLVSDLRIPEERLMVEWMALLPTPPPLLDESEPTLPLRILLRSSKGTSSGGENPDL